MNMRLTKGKKKCTAACTRVIVHENNGTVVVIYLFLCYLFFIVY